MMVVTNEMLARQIVNRCFSAHDHDIDTLAAARKINETEGWSFETFALQGHILITGGVHVEEEVLVKAHQYAVDHYVELC